MAERRKSREQETFDFVKRDVAVTAPEVLEVLRQIAGRGR